MNIKIVSQKKVSDKNVDCTTYWGEFVSSLSSFTVAMLNDSELMQKLNDFKDFTSLESMRYTSKDFNPILCGSLYLPVGGGQPTTDLISFHAVGKEVTVQKRFISDLSYPLSTTLRGFALPFVWDS
jgi:hypothetical protein